MSSVIQKYSDRIQRLLELKVEANPESSFSVSSECHHCRKQTQSIMSIERNSFRKNFFTPYNEHRSNEQLHRSIFDELQAKTKYFDFHSLDEWVDSVADGCNMCTHLWETLKRIYLKGAPLILNLGQNKELREMKLLDQERWPAGSEKLTLGVFHNNYGDVLLLKPDGAIWELMVSIPYRSMRNWLIYSRLHDLGRKSIYTGSNTTFRLASDWLWECTTGHADCDIRDVKRYPTRLLDVGHDLTSTDGDNPLRQFAMVRLIEGPSQIMEKPPYLCLSHRWPTAPILMLNSATEACLRSGITLDMLPLTFQDAITIVRRLGHRYLWIDSLCIFQDSQQDWIIESNKMGDIYRGSVCTIGSLNSATINARCFAIRNPLQLLENHFHDWERNLQVNRDILGHSSDILYPKGQLQSRGWVFQERILSPRMIYYSADEILWECITTSTCESRHMVKENRSEFFENPKQGYAKLSRSLQSEFSNLIHSRFAVMTFTKEWRQLLQEYTGCDLTFSKDRLPAITGIQQSIAQASGLSTYQGMWNEILHIELLWYASNPQLSMSPIQSESWTWAALDVQVTNDYVELLSKGAFNLEWMLSVVKWTEIKTRRQLHIEAPVRPVSSLTSHTRKKLNLESYYDPRVKPMRLCNMDRAHSNPGRGNNYAILAARGTSNEIRSRESGGKMFFDSRLCDIGLILEKSRDVEGAYCRVGYFEEHYWEGETGLIFDSGEPIIKQNILLV